MRMHKHIAATAGLVAALGGFGVGAYALAQGGASFDPSNFMAAYSQGAQDRTKGYQANPTDSDAQANRQDNGDQNSGTNTNNRAEQQTPTASDVPVTGASGTTAVRMTGGGTGAAAVAGTGNGGGNGTGAGNVTSGPVIPGSGDNAGGNGGGTGGNGGNGGNGGSGENPGGTSAATENSYRVLPSDPTPSSKDLNQIIDEKPVSPDNEAIKDLTSDQVYMIRIVAGNSLGSDPSETDLYVGQKLDAWTVFCAIDANYIVEAADGTRDSYAWVCTRDEFSSYDYFKVTEFPDVVPSGAFKVKGSYRINDKDTWHDWEVEYTPEQSCVFVVSGEKDADGNPVVLKKIVGGDSINLNDSLEQAIESHGYGEMYQEITHVLLGWKEGDTEIDLNAVYKPEPGRHVIEPGTFAKVPEGCTVILDGAYEEDISDFVRYQALVDVSDGSEVVEESNDGKRTLKVPEGITKVDFEGDNCVEFDYLSLPSTAQRVEASGACLRVKRGFKVDADNALYATTKDGILTNKAGTEYYGIPTGLKTLTIPEGVTSVNLPQDGAISKIVVEATSSDEIPALDLSGVYDCEFVVDEKVGNAFVSSYCAAFSEMSGNTLRISNYPDIVLTGNRGIMTSGTRVMLIADTGSRWAVLNGPMGRVPLTLAKDCLAHNDRVDTLVLDGSSLYELEDGCLEGSTISNIVCSNEDVAQYVEGRLEAAGAPEANVVVAEVSQEGYEYYADGGGTVLLSAPSSVVDFYGTFTAADGSTIEPYSIAAWAFEGCYDLQWAQTAEGTEEIGEEAFYGCDALQGLFIGRLDAVHTELRAFASCANMRYLASRSQDGIIDTESQDIDMLASELPNSSCVMYAPTGAFGYNYSFTSFTEASGVGDYSVLAQDDGSLLLCGDDAFGTPCLVLAGAASYNGEVRLPEDTFEIYTGAFSGVGGSFTINWRDLYRLQYVDWQSFNDSGLSGEVYVGTPDMWRCSIADSAFANCSGITTVVSESSYTNLGSGAFFDCDGLTSFTCSSSAGGIYGIYFSQGVFYGCENLTDIEFTSYSAPDVSLYGSGVPFCFDGSVSADADAERIRVKVPEGAEENYLEAWTYVFSGFADYDECYKYVFDDMLYNRRSSTQAAMPSDAEVKAEMSRLLTAGENRLRKMLGMPQVEKSSFFSSQVVNGCTFDTVDGEVRLAAVSRDLTEIDLSQAVPEDVESFIIPADVFSKCTQLKRIVLSDKVSEIQTGAFNGCDGVTVVLPDVDDDLDTTPIELTGGDDWIPFDFGGQIKLEVPEGSAEKYLKVWPQQMYGLDEWTVYSYVGNIYSTLLEVHSVEEITVEMLNYAVNDPFVQNENLLRGMMGLPEVESYKDACSFYDASWYLDVWGDAGDLDDPDDPDNPDDIWGDQTKIPDPDGDESSGGNDADTGGSMPGDDEMVLSADLNAEGGQTPAGTPAA